MNRFNLVVLSLLSVVLFIGCDKLEYDLGNDDNSDIDQGPSSEESVIYKDEVYLLNNSMVDSVRIVNDTTIHVYSKNKIENYIKLNQIISYQDTVSSQNYFIGEIVQFSQEGNCVKINTQVPSLAEVFDQLSISPSFVQSNTSVDYIPDESDIVEYTGVVSNSIWDEIETVYESKELVSRSSNKSTSLPIDLTLAFEAKPNNAFNGSIYLRLEGSAHISDNGSYELSVNQTIGLKGSFNLASVSKQRMNIPLLAIKNGITLYSNKIVSLRLKPSFNFFYSGKISLEAGFNYEIVNADTYVSYENGVFYSKSYENERHPYFRVKSLHTEAEFGFSLNCDLYLFIFSESFFSCGINTIAGLGVGGEKNVGIQFPELVNFDCSVYFTPILEVKPFVAFKMLELKRIEGPTMKIKTNKFEVSLLPNIHNIKYKRKSKDLQVSSEMDPDSLSFIDTEEDGIALFEKGAKIPIACSSISKNSEAISDNNFSIYPNKIYELAPYSRTIHDEVYGERIVVDVDPLTLFYESANGDHWINNTNWCSNKPISEWFGVCRGYYSDDEFFRLQEIRLPNNNLSGTPIVYGFRDLQVLDIRENYFSELTISNCSRNSYLDSLILDNCINLTKFDINNCNINSITTTGANIVDMKVSNCSIYSNNQSFNFENLQTLKNVEIRNCVFHSAEKINLKNNFNIESIIIEGCEYVRPPVGLSGSKVNNVTIRDCKCFGLYSSIFDGGYFENILIENSMDAVQQFFGGSEGENSTFNVNRMEFKNHDDIGRIFFENVLAAEISFYDCHFLSEGISVMGRSNVSKVVFVNCTIPSGMLDCKCTTYLTSSNIGDWRGCNGYFVISNCTIEGIYISSLSGSGDAIDEYLRKIHERR